MNKNAESVSQESTVVQDPQYSSRSTRAPKPPVELSQQLEAAERDFGEYSAEAGLVFMKMIDYYKTQPAEKATTELINVLEARVEQIVDLYRDA